VLPVEDAEGEGRVLTASADRTVKLWLGSECERTYEGHGDVVRSLAAVPGIGFLSCSNDGTVRLWELGGGTLQVLRASESFVYAVAVLPGGEWVTCSEDRTVRVWRSGSDDCVQAITHPTTVWAVAPLPNGDVISGCADGKGYVWSREPSRAASEGDASLFKECVASAALPEQQVAEGMLGDLDTRTLKTEEALLEPGKKEGQHLIVRDSQSNTPMLYQWSSASATWEKVGEVVGGKGDGGGSSATIGKRMFEGQEYDYLVEIDMNGAPLQLPFNRGDDPWMSAQKWLWRHELDQGFLDEVANHIIKNTPDNVPSAGYGNVDPFTAGGAYRPSAPSSSAGASAGNVDPFTSAGAYRPGAPTAGAGCRVHLCGHRRVQARRRARQADAVQQ